MKFNLIKNNMNRRQYVFFGAMAAIGFVVAFVIGTGVIALTGIPMTGGLVSGIFFFCLFVIGVRSVPKFGSATIIILLSSILMIPTTIFGPPGIYKVFLALIVGFIFDGIILLFKKSDWGYIIGVVITGQAIVLSVFFAAIILGLPGADKMKDALVILLTPQLVIDFLAGYLGIKIYNKKLAKLDLFKRLAE